MRAEDTGTNIYHSRYLAEIEELKAINAELLAALKGVMSIWDNPGSDLVDEALIARAVIANVEREMAKTEGREYPSDSEYVSYKDRQREDLK